MTAARRGAGACAEHFILGIFPTGRNSFIRFVLNAEASYVTSSILGERGRLCAQNKSKSLCPRTPFWWG